MLYANILYVCKMNSIVFSDRNRAIYTEKLPEHVDPELWRTRDWNMQTCTRYANSYVRELVSSQNGATAPGREGPIAAAAREPGHVVGITSAS